MFEAVLDGLRDGVLLIDPEGKIVFANQSLADIFVIPGREMLGRRLIEAIRLAELSDLVDEVNESKRSHEREIKSFYPAEKTLHASVNIVRDGTGREIGTSVIIRDVTEVKKLENLRSEFVANVSHELKTPLTAIRGLAETLAAGAINDAAHNLEFVGKIEKQAETLSALIDDLLEISKLESRRGLGDFVRLDAAAIARRAVETIAEKARRKKVAISFLCEGDGYFISGVDDHIYRAILNLLDNAVNYSDAGGEVRVICGGDKGQVRIDVADTGIGVPHESLPRIFERFYRVEKARSRDLGGTGLGLSIVKHVMHIHNGSVAVESEEGKGSRFTLILPARPAGGPAA